MSGRAESPDVKQCCALAYSSDVARYLLGESFHPGGTALTGELGTMLRLDADATVLDVACGTGASAFALAERFGCRVTGVDLSMVNVDAANAEATKREVAHRVTFVLGDAERLPFAAGTFDAIVCECAFCTFPDKAAAALEFRRVLRLGGCVGISDLTRSADDVPELDGLLAWIACVGDAQPLDRYAAWLNVAGFTTTIAVARDACLHDMVDQIRGRLMLAEVMIGLKKIELPSLDIEAAKRFASAAAIAVREKKLGYAILVAELSPV